jgi:hypothetical protein
VFLAGRLYNRRSYNSGPGLRLGAAVKHMEQGEPETLPALTLPGF